MPDQPFAQQEHRRLGRADGLEVLREQDQQGRRQPLAQRFGRIPPVLARQVFRDDHDRSGLMDIGPGNRTPGEHGISHRLEVPWRDALVTTNARQLSTHLRELFDEDGSTTVVVVHRHR